MKTHTNAEGHKGGKVDLKEQKDDTGILTAGEEDIEVNFKIKYEHLLYGMISMALVLILT